jgi:hypothetical protein
MIHCEQCGREFDGAQCPACGADSFDTWKELNRKLAKYFYISLAGMAAELVAARVYPLLDSSRLALWSVFLVFLPMVPHIILSRKKRVGANLEWLTRLYLGCGCAVVLIVLATIANGALDKSPVQTISTTVSQKRISSSRRSKSYIVVADSWRPGKDEESLTVNRGLYQTLKVGQSIVVDVHPGALGMPWYSRVAPDPQAQP